MNEIRFSPPAGAQIKLILEHDPTVEDKVLRLLISGKGCEGFDYSLGFTDSRPGDLMVAPVGSDFEVAMDPFTARYLKRGYVDFVQNFDRHQEGFTVTNLDQSQYKGKFWKKN